MPSIHRFLLKTLCVFGVLFTLPHNTAWGSCCTCYGDQFDNKCDVNTSDPSCDSSNLILGNCYSEDQYWCRVTKKGTPQCADNLEATMGFCPSKWYCDEPDKPGTPGTESSSCDGCLNQHTMIAENGINYCGFYGIGDTPSSEKYKFEWIFQDKKIDPKDTDKTCIKSESGLYDITCNVDKFYYQDSSSVYCDIELIGEKWYVTACHGCSSEPCYDCDDVSDGFWVNGCGIDEQYPRKAITCDTPEKCGYTDPSDPMYQKIKAAPNVYVRVLEYSFDDSGNGSCTISWLDIIDCVLGYYYIEETKTCEPCPIGYIGDTISDGSLFYWWRATCTPCSTGESTFSTKTIDGKTVIDKLLNAQVREDSKTTAPCTKCPKGYKWEKYTDTSLPDYQETYICTLCSSGTYNDTEGATDCKNCSDIVKKGDSPFTSDTPDPSKGLINDSIQMCYIDPNVMLSDSLGTIKLSEEIGSGTKLYHQ